MKSHEKRNLIICLTVALLVLIAHLFGLFEGLELKTLDARFKWRGTRPVHPDIAIITIDEESIKELGRWPWPRRVHAQVVRNLAKAGAKVVAFDTLFTVLDHENWASDHELSKAAKETGIVVSAFFFNAKEEHSSLAKEPVFPYEPLASSSQLGYVNLDPDFDGVTRRAPLVLFEETEDKGKLAVYPALSVAALAVSRKQTFDEVLPTLPIKIDPANATGSDNHIVLNYAIPYEGQDNFYPMTSFIQVLNGSADLEKLFKDKIVFVGVTAAGLFDLKAIPFISKHPGVMIHANALDNLLTGHRMRQMGAMATWAIVLLLGLVFGWLLPKLVPWLQLGVFGVLTAAGVIVSAVLFSTANLIVPMVAPLAAQAGCYGGVLFYRLVIEEREKRKIKGSFRQYLSHKVIDIITKDPSKLKLGGEEREVTVFFLDIAGFTTMSERLKPTQLVEVMNYCLTQFSSVILKHDGLINKYIGDCIMAFWNAPADQPLHATQACLAALECMEILPSINQHFKERGLPEIDCRIGVNTGTVVVGNMGSNERFDYTVLGDPVNLASRLEGANKQYNTHIMISDVTFEQAKDVIEARDLDLIRVKGKKEPRKVFEVLGKKGQLPEEVATGKDKYHVALKMYRDKQFEEAIHAFSEVLHYLPDDHVTRVYLERVRSFVSHPPAPGWDGVFELKTK